METWIRTCGPYPGGLILTHAHVFPLNPGNKGFAPGFFSHRGHRGAGASREALLEVWRVVAAGGVPALQRRIEHSRGIRPAPLRVPLLFQGRETWRAGGVYRGPKRRCKTCWLIGVFFGLVWLKIDGTGFPLVLIIYQCHVFVQKNAYVLDASFKPRWTLAFLNGKKKRP